MSLHRYLAATGHTCSSCGSKIRTGGNVWRDPLQRFAGPGICDDCDSDMDDLRIGSLFTGYGGLDIATEAAFGASTAWVSDIDKGACKILAHRYSDVPNIGDITVVDWSAVEAVDIITGGSPCQDLSHAGRRAGMSDGTRSNLWVQMREAIATIRPTYVIWENVRGAYSAAADSAVESCPGCVGDGSAVHLRALGRVLGDLSDLGYDTEWRGLRAADVGAPHGRFRVFVVARLADAPSDSRRGVFNRNGRSPADAPGNGRHEGWAESTRLVGRPDVAQRRGISTVSLLNRVEEVATDPVLLDRVNRERDRLLPSPRTSDTNGAGAHGDGGLDLRTDVTLLPTPTVQASKQGGGEADRGAGSPDDANLWISVRRPDFGRYDAAIGQWELTTRTTAPDPTEPTGRSGAHRLSPRFTEWMMGLPAGWITDVPGMTRNEALKACGNGVVPQQAYAAIADSLAAFAAEVAA